jgi:hypothetical protein
MEFLKLTDWKTREPVYLDPNKILFIQQIAEHDDYSRHTRIDIIGSSQIFLVSEDADQIALVSGRGFQDI